VYAQSGVKGYWGDSVSVNGVQIGSSPVGYAQSVDVDIDGTTAQRLRARIQRSVLPSSEDAPVTAGKALFVALVAGVKDDLDPAIARLFRVSGCSHLLALSGMHLGLLCAVPALLLKRRIGPRKAAVVATVIAAVYVFFIGPKPSLLRAAVMYAAATYCFYRDTRVASVSILSISFVILITVLPASALDVSFQLSFLALSGILLFAPIAARYASRWIPPGVASAVCAAFGAQLATVGLVAKVFGVVYPVGMIASIVLLPVIILHVGAGILLGIGGMARLLPQALVDAGLELTHALVAEIARFFASAPQLAVGGPGPWALLGLPILLFAAGRVASTIRRAR
jgi:competence protein ComEC